MAPTSLSQKAARLAPPDLSSESIDLLIRERGIMTLAADGLCRAEAKRILFLGFLIRQRGLQADGAGAL